MQESDNLLRIFKETKDAVSRGDSAKIKSLSNQTTNTAALTHDPDNIAAAVMVYSLSKILEREDYKALKGWKKFHDTYLVSIDKIIIALEKKDDKEYRNNLEQINRAMGKLSGKLKEYVEEVFRKAKVNKASRIYEHGISKERTAKLLGITLFELADYTGQKDKSIEAVQGKDVNVKSRIKVAMEMFS